MILRVSLWKGDQCSGIAVHCVYAMPPTPQDRLMLSADELHWKSLSGLK